MPDTKISADSSAGTLDGTEIVPVVRSGTNLRTTVQEITAAAPMSLAGLNLPDWVNQGSATIADEANVGVVLTVPSSGGDSVRGRMGAVPSAPYHKRFKLSVMSIQSNFRIGGVGWYDDPGAGGTGKVLGIEFAYVNAWLVRTMSYATPTTGPGQLTSDGAPQQNNVWFGLQDDGAGNYALGLSYSGAAGSFRSITSGAKSGSFLGASGFRKLILYGNMIGQPGTITVLDYLPRIGA